MKEKVHNTQPIDLEENLKRIAQIADQMEQDILSLETSLSLFEEGVKLIRCSQQALEEAHQKVSILMENEQKDVLEPYFKKEE